MLTPPPPLGAANVCTLSPPSVRAFLSEVVLVVCIPEIVFITSSFPESPSRASYEQTVKMTFKLRI
jgi:hypothetical protein